MLIVEEEPLKLLMFNVTNFWYKPFKKTVATVRETKEPKTILDTLVVFVNVEREKTQKKRRKSSEKA